MKISCLLVEDATGPYPNGKVKRKNIINARFKLVNKFATLLITLNTPMHPFDP